MLYILHENDDWLEPFRQTFGDAGLAFTEWHMAGDLPDLASKPPRGVFYVRMSASAHTRGHQGVPELTAGVLCWLERHGRRVINGSAALDLELSKLRQYQALMQHGLQVPLTYAACSPAQLLHLARQMPAPFVTKHNRAGMGLGVELFEDFNAFESRLDAVSDNAPVDGVTLLQQYIDSPEPFITRCEFIDGQFVYAVRVDTSQGFELCPADACSVSGETEPSEHDDQRFQIVTDFSDPVIDRYQEFLYSREIDVAGIEFIIDRAGDKWTYDVNVNTNYSTEAEDRAGVSAHVCMTDFLRRELAKC